MMQQKIRTLCFAGAAFAGDHNALIAAFSEHRLHQRNQSGHTVDRNLRTDLIRGIGNRKNVRRQVTQSAILVQLNIFWVVNWIKFERINGDEN